MPTRILNCNYCGEEFTAELTYTRGRPPAFCKEEHRLAARYDRTRICAWAGCKTPFQLGAPGTHEKYCSDVCRDESKYSCRYCHGPITLPHGKLRHLYCKEEHQQLAGPPKICSAPGCNQTTPLPKLPAALRGYPRFCNDVCRQIFLEQFNPRMRIQRMDRNFFDHFAQHNTAYLLDELPLHGDGLPYWALPPHPYDDPALLSRRVQVSLTFWREFGLPLLAETLTPGDAAAYYISHGRHHIVGTYPPDFFSHTTPLWNLTPWLLRQLTTLWSSSWINEVQRGLHSCLPSSAEQATLERRIMKIANSMDKSFKLAVEWFTKVDGPTKFAQLCQQYETLVMARPMTVGLQLPHTIPAGMDDYWSKEADVVSAIDSTAVGRAHREIQKRWMPASLQWEPDTKTTVGPGRWDVIGDATPPPATVRYALAYRDAYREENGRFINGPERIRT